MKGTVPDYSSGLKQDLSCKNIPLLSRYQEKKGPGKTTIGSLLIRSFIDLSEMPVLAVDADPNANLHEALGVPVHETLGCMREEAFSRQIPPGMNRHDYVRFRFRQAVVESKGFDLVAMGRPEGSGCYCFANDLLSECVIKIDLSAITVLSLSIQRLEWSISAGERSGKPDMLLIVSDPGARGLRKIIRIREIATQFGLEPERIKIVFNRFKSGAAPVDIGDNMPIAIIPDDPHVEAADLAATFTRFHRFHSTVLPGLQC